MQSPHMFGGDAEANRLAGTRVFQSAMGTRKLLIVCAAMLSTLPAFAQTGKLDPTCGSGGVFVTGDASFPNAPAAAIQTNEEIIVAGQFNGLPGIARLTTSGALDPTFGNDGIAITTIDSSDIASLVGIGLPRVRSSLVFPLSSGRTISLNCTREIFQTGLYGWRFSVAVLGSKAGQENLDPASNQSR